ncbi:MAG: hypothetical protein RL701_265 [Pseudomonadota bacterium]|jgi:hypothetical protein
MGKLILTEFVSLDGVLEDGCVLGQELARSSDLSPLASAWQRGPCGSGRPPLVLEVAVRKVDPRPSDM